MSNSTTITIQGKEHTLKLGALSITRKIRVEKIDLSQLTEDMGIDEFFVFLAKLMIPKEEQTWDSDEDLIQALEDENDLAALMKLRDKFNEYLGFILTLSSQSELPGEEKPKRSKK